MSVRQDTLWEQFLKPVVRSLIDEDSLRRLQESIDWESEAERLRNPYLVYPSYYKSQNFHGIEGGYLNSGSAVTYDPITQYVLVPNETWVREAAIKAILGQPRRILDLGCGTGSTTLMLKQAFPNSEVIGLDLSPYMLVMADYKATQAGLEIQWQHGKAEATGFPNASFDVVSASLLFHETPPDIAKAILNEAFRLLVPGGEVIILDGNQKTLRQVEWLTNVFEEPYIQDYAAGCVDVWMRDAGFQGVKTEDFWWIHSITRGMKPLSASETAPSQTARATHDIVEGMPAPAF